MRSLEGKTVIVTGGGRGIGRAICEKFASEGAVVWIADLVSKDAQSCAESIQDGGGIANSIQVDVSDEVSVRAMAEQIAQESGIIDVLVNNAGIGLAKSVFDTTVEEWDRLMAIDVRGIFLCCKHVVPHMMRTGRGGTVINMGSCAGQIGVALQSAYSAAKGAVNQFTKSLALELGPQNIRVCAIAPGVVDTDLVKKLEKGYDEVGFDLLASVEERQMGGLLLPEDIANMAAFLASEEARGVHGAIVPIDAGVCAS